MMWRGTRPGRLEIPHLNGIAALHGDSPFAGNMQAQTSLAYRAFFSAFHLSTTAGTAACAENKSQNQLVKDTIGKA